MEKKLNELIPGEIGIIKSVDIAGSVRRRFYDMGLIPGAQVVFRKTAPLGDPMEIGIRGYSLALRKSEAQHILLETVNK